MKIPFSKYQGTGNDFIIVNNSLFFYDKLTTTQIKFLCDRRFGLGADGLILIQPCQKNDFMMIYFNSDGNEGSMCGNGGRCVVQYAHQSGMIGKNTKFETIDGVHEASINGNIVKLLMSDVSVIDQEPDYYYLNTGSPHYVAFVKDVKNFNVFEEGRKIRYNEHFNAKGTNVNFVEKFEDTLFVRTYERGVEDETFSCGTGVVASAIAATYEKPLGNYEHNIETKGGLLKVSFEKLGTENYRNIYLEGPAEFIFAGEITIPEK